jgi:glycosyltransferase involved in cell wall biosynthesis
MSQNPAISILVITRNRVRYLKRLLDNILTDDYQPRELIVVDGASTDGTVDLLRSYGDRISKWISEPDRCEAEAWHKAVALSSGEIIKLIGDDDLIRVGALRTAAEYFRKHPETEILFGQAQCWDDRFDPPKLVDDTPKLDTGVFTVRNVIRREQRFPYSLSVFMRRKTFIELGGFSPAFTGVDIEYWARCVALGAKIRIAPETFVDIFLTGDNVSLKKAAALRRDLVRAAVMYGDSADIRFAVTRYVKQLATAAVATPFHALELHPRRRLARWLSRLSQ